MRDISGCGGAVDANDKVDDVEFIWFEVVVSKCHQIVHNFLPEGEGLIVSADPCPVLDLSLQPSDGSVGRSLKCEGVLSPVDVEINGAVSFWRWGSCGLGQGGV